MDQIELLIRYCSERFVFELKKEDKFAQIVKRASHRNRILNKFAMVKTTLKKPKNKTSTAQKKGGQGKGQKGLLETTLPTEECM